MNREQIEELAALRALGLLEGEERRAFEEALRTDPEARRIADAFDTAATSVAMTVEQVEPPPALKSRVLAALPDRLPAASAPALPPAAPPKVVRFRWLPWAIAAGLALVAGVTLEHNRALREELAVARRQADTDAWRIAVLTSLLQEHPDAQAVCVWNTETQEGVLNVSHLPPLAPDKDYQLWVVDPQYPNPVDGGVFNTAADGTFRFTFVPKQAVARVAAFAVSEEIKGGVPVAQGRMVMSGSR